MTMCAYFSTMIFIILWTSICLQDAQAIRKPFEVVKMCPFNESEWKVRAAHMTCNGSESYHCLLTEGGVSLREQCTETSLFTSGFCPIFTNEGYLQWSACKDIACPASSYRSDQVYQYQICYRKADNPIEKNTGKGSNDSSSVTGVTIIIVAILVVFILVLVSVFVVFYKRNQFGFKDKAQQCISNIRTHFQQRSTGLPDVENDAAPGQLMELLLPADVENNAAPGQSIGLLLPGMYDDTHQKTYKLNDLLKYFVHILKQELGVNDLKEKVVIHSKSINEHFNEPLIKELQSVKDLNDYSNFDVSVVFALLRNFCEGVKSPSRGWEYEPRDNETHVGADIERIRSMWNKYCDDDFEFKHLDEVYDRIKQKYGTVAVHGDDGVKNSPLEYEEKAEGFETMKFKIQSIKLNPDYMVEKGIVITGGIITALKFLKSRNVVILKGVIGCGKTHALKAIQNHFQERNWETEWVKSENFQGKTSYEKQTILLCDNFFGTFGSNVFSQDDVNKTEQFLREIECSKQTKVVIVIHKHVDDEIKKSLKLNFLHQKNITVDMDTLSEAETLLIFKEQQQKGHCRSDSNCWFKTVGCQFVLDKLSKNPGHIGNPFLSLIYCDQHELFADDAFSVNPIQTLMEHFKKIREESTSLYCCLVYLMCVQEHNCEEEPKTWGGTISADITKDSFEKIARKSSYVQVDKSKITLAHDILTIPLYKSAAERHEYLMPLVKNFEIGIMLQFLRPPDTCHNNIYCNFIDVNRNDSFKTIGKEFVYRYASSHQGGKINHPLLTIDFVKERYCKYLNRSPKHKRMSK